MTLILSNFAAQFTKNTDKFGKMDPYMIIDVAGQSQKSSVQNNAGVSPVWPDTFTFMVTPNDQLRIRFFDKDLFGSDHIGELSVPLSQVINAQKASLPFVGQKSSGNVTFNSIYYPAPMATGPSYTVPMNPVPYNDPAYGRGYNATTYTPGNNPGYNQGYNPGYNQGYNPGYNQGYNPGYNQGYNTPTSGQGYGPGYGTGLATGAPAYNAGFAGQPQAQTYAQGYSAPGSAQYNYSTTTTSVVPTTYGSGIKPVGTEFVGSAAPNLTTTTVTATAPTSSLATTGSGINSYQTTTVKEVTTNTTGGSANPTTTYTQTTYQTYSAGPTTGQ